MASKVEVKRKTVTKRDRSKVKGRASRKKVTVRASGRGNANYVASAKRPKKK
jgi:hypothetical protein